MSRVPLAAVALVCVFAVALAGCGLSPAGESGQNTVDPDLQETPTATATPTPASTTDGGALPPGVSPGATTLEREVDETALVQAHHAALTERSLTVRVRTTWTAPDGTVTRYDSTVVRVGGFPIRYRSVTGGPDAPNATRRYESWTNGSVTYIRQETADGTTRLQRIESLDRDPLLSTPGISTGRNYIETPLFSVELAYVGVVTVDGDRLHLLVGGRGETELTVRVTDEGVVRSFVYRTVQGDGADRRERLERFRLSKVGETTVERPPWARPNATGDG